VTVLNDKFSELANLGAGDFEHLDGTLLEHLNATRQLLNEWGASAELQDAGLYHAAYGTAGFDESMVSIDQRDQIAAIIGKASEEIVFQYCACDRKSFFPAIGKISKPEFKNRFTGSTYYLSEVMLRNFCELTAANEIEIASDNPVFLRQHGAELNDLFIKMADNLSVHAQAKAAEVFGASASYTVV